MSDIANLEVQITELQEAVEKKDLAFKLEKNPEFKKLILDGFCEKECARFARNSGDPSIPKEMREDSLAMAQAAGHLRRWLSVTVRMGLRAEEEIRQAREAITEMHQEGQE